MTLRRRDVMLGGAAAGLAGCASTGALLGLTEPVRLRTRLGEVEGDVDAAGIRRFLGVPYAAPPTGPRRFRPPEPPAPWSGVHAARRYAPMGMQAGDGVKSEDSLYLNIWSPATPGPHPVFVWVHAGGNARGTVDDPRYDGTSFAMNDVVAVTITHRMGVWGFLELGDVLGPEYADSGNNGIKDIAAALAWVRDNIADYGGDPSRVAIGGLSSGAKNTCALMAAPSAAGLFQSAVIESGGGQTVHSLEKARAIAAEYLSAGGVRDGRDLLSASEGRLLRDQERFAAGYEESFPFRAVVGGEFLPELPLDAIAAGAGADVRVLIGGTRDEGALFLGGRRGGTPFAQSELAHATVAEADRILAAYERAFPGDTALERRVRLISAEQYWVPTMRVADARANLASAAETYLYRFDWRARAGRFEGWAPHGAEAAFVWNTADAEARAGAPADAAFLRMHEMWVSFLHGRSPALPEGPDWPVYAAPDRRLMAIEADLQVIAPDDRQLALWDGVI